MKATSLLSPDLCKRLAFELVWGNKYMSRSEIEVRVAKFLERIGRSERGLVPSSTSPVVVTGPVQTSDGHRQAE